jgi:hypothetical protein
LDRLVAGPVADLLPQEFLDIFLQLDRHLHTVLHRPELAKTANSKL